MRVMRPFRHDISRRSSEAVDLLRPPMVRRFKGQSESGISTSRTVDVILRKADTS